MKYVIASTLAVLCAGAAMTAQTQTAATLTGCVYKESDVPGRTPNVAERVGVMEDYILADAKVSESATNARPTGTSGSAGSMYKLEKISDDKLKAVVGKRVEVTGRIDADKGETPSTPSTAKPDKNPISPDKIELPEFEVTSMKEVAGTCPAKPAAR